jgi:hypothetical protein
MNRIVSAAALVVLLGSVAACQDDDDGPSTATDPSTTTQLEFTEQGGCGDAYFWATTADDEHAVVISAELRERSATEVTVFEVDLPDPAVEVFLWEGTGLQSLMCNDLVDGEVTEETPVVEGHLTITLQPRPQESMDLVDGKAVLTGLVAEDGTELPDLDLKTTSIGFYAG